MNKIYLASGNDHKRKEVAELLPLYKIILPKDEGLFFEPEETGSSFFENAMLKAKALYKLVHAPVLADDSGLCIDALNGRPGIYSARYGTENSTSSGVYSGITRVLSELDGIPNRKAHFACCLVLMTGDDRFCSVQEICSGSITKKVCGKGGFGYDPIFFVEQFGKTFAELTAEEKNKISHRGLAMKKIAKFLNDVNRES